MTQPQHTETWLEQVRRAVEQALEELLEPWREELRAASPHGEALLAPFADLVLRGGKRLRPALAAAAFTAAGGTEDEADARGLGRLGAALELLQGYLLVHDDWMDGDLVRRGGPAVHAVFREQTGARHLGDALGVVAGDLGCLLAWRALLSVRFPERRTEAALRRWSVMQQEVLLGQQLDLLGHPDSGLVHQLKTGSYTVRGPLVLGGLLAGAEPPLLEALERFGTPLGEAFQLRDDLLGTFGDPRRTGKPVGADLLAGKRTAIVEEAERRLSQAERAPLWRVLARPEAGEGELRDAVELLERSGVRAAVEARAEARLAEALEALERAPVTDVGRTRLRWLAERMVRRND